MNFPRFPSSAPLPPEKPKFWPIYRPKAGQVLRVISLSQSVLGVLTHWVDGRELPCTRTHGECVCTRAPLEVRWTGFLCVVMSDVRQRPAILPITAHAFRQSRELSDPVRDLRGVQLQYRRESGCAFSKCWVKVVEPKVSSGSIPPAFDLWNSLVSLWFHETKSFNEHFGQS